MPNWSLAQLKPGTIAFSDEVGGAAAGRANLISFDEWGRTRPAQKKFLSLFPGYTEPTVAKTASAGASTGPVPEKLTMYVAQARFVLDRPPGSIDLSRYVTLPFLEKIDPAIKHKTIAAADVNSLKDQQGTGNAESGAQMVYRAGNADLHPVELQARRQDSDRRHAGQQAARQRQEGFRSHRF